MIDASHPLSAALYEHEILVDGVLAQLSPMPKTVGHIKLTAKELTEELLAYRVRVANDSARIQQEVTAVRGDINTYVENQKAREQVIHEHYSRLINTITKQRDEVSQKYSDLLTKTRPN